MISKEEVRHALTGPVFSVSTLFQPDGAIDYPGVYRLIDSLIDVGQKVIILTAGDSLFTVLTDQEVAELTKATVQHIAGRAVVVAADQSWWTGKTVDFARYCREVGVDILMVQPPDWASSCTPDTLVAHFAAVAEHIPVMLVTNFLEPWPPPRYVELFEKLRDGRWRRSPYYSLNDGEMETLKNFLHSKGWM